MRPCGSPSSAPSSEYGALADRSRSATEGPGSLVAKVACLVCRQSLVYGGDAHEESGFNDRRTGSCGCFHRPNVCRRCPEDQGRLREGQNELGRRSQEVQPREDVTRLRYQAAGLSYPPFIFAVGRRKLDAAGGQRSASGSRGYAGETNLSGIGKLRIVERQPQVAAPKCVRVRLPCTHIRLALSIPWADARLIQVKVRFVTRFIFATP